MNFKFFSLKGLLPLLLIIVIAITFGCKRENVNPQWDIEILAPLIKTSLTANNIVADSLTDTIPSGALSFAYDHDIYSTPVDSIFKIEDTTLITLYPNPIPASWPLNAGTPIPFTSTNDFILKLNSIELNTAIIKKGFVHLTILNHLATAVIDSFKIPKATLGKNGPKFSFTKILGPAVAGNPALFDSLIDMSGYWLDLTGPNGLDYNRLTYEVNCSSAPTSLGGVDIMINIGDVLIDLKTGFEQILPIYAKGYLGQTSVTDSSENNIGLTQHLLGGTFLLDSATISLTIKNSVGADAQAKVTSMFSVNEKTGIPVPLVCPSLINRSLNLNRATESGPPISKPNASLYNVTFDNSNSNIIQFIENLPTKITYDIEFALNPLGNVSSHNDFIYTDDIFTANLKVNIPFRFATNQLAWLDTQSVAIKPSKNYDYVGPSTFTLIADNGFPMTFDLRLYILDKNNQCTDTLLVPGLIAAAPIDINNKAYGKQRTKITIPVSETRRDNILNAAQIAIKALVTTQSYPQLLQIYSNYSLDLKLIGDVQYTIH